MVNYFIKILNVILLKNCLLLPICLLFKIPTSTVDSAYFGTFVESSWSFLIFRVFRVSIQLFFSIQLTSIFVNKWHSLAIWSIFTTASQLHSSLTMPASHSDFKIATLFSSSRKPQFINFYVPTHILIKTKQNKIRILLFASTLWIQGWLSSLQRGLKKVPN